jgi:hypothetical protein
MVGVYKPDESIIESSNLTEVKDLEPTEAEVTPLNVTDEKTDWTQVMIIVGVSNLVLILIAGGIFFVLRRRSKNAGISLDDELTDEFKPKEESYDV